MTNPYTDYLNAAADLDTHLNECLSCAVGTNCPAGDDIAEREYRTDREWRRNPTKTARGGDR